MVSSIIGRYLGSSPHARGALDESLGYGKLAWDHPRMRGEHRHAPRHGEHPQGIIPACAGSTPIRDNQVAQVAGSSPHARGALQKQLASGNGKRDHPRMRGEHRAPADVARAVEGIIPACAGSTKNASNASSWRLGSSPHARGAQAGALSHRAGRGIIPACAGSTAATRGRARPRRGSSPHARGAPQTVTIGQKHRQDHPRMRGEHRNRRH